MTLPFYLLFYSPCSLIDSQGCWHQVLDVDWGQVQHSAANRNCLQPQVSRQPLLVLVGGMSFGHRFLSLFRSAFRRSCCVYVRLFVKSPVRSVEFHAFPTRLRSHFSQATDDISVGNNLEQCLVQANTTNKDLVVIVRGPTVDVALTYHQAAFSKLLLSAHAVICCRVSPAQKAQVGMWSFVFSLSLLSLYFFLSLSVPVCVCVHGTSVCWF